MKFKYKKETNLEIGQELYGIIEVSIYTYDGVHPITVYEVDYNNDEVIFKVDQPCEYVACSFRNMENLVFESKEEAEEVKSKLDFGKGLYAYDWY